MIVADGLLWLIRHGETEWSRSGAHTGRTDIPLTATGQRQAEDLRERLQQRRFAFVLTSPLQRARETCRLAGYGGVAEVSEDLLEWDYGAYEGRTTAEIQQKVPGWSIWTGSVPNGETAEEVAARTRRVIDRVISAQEDTALFAHGHVLRILAACWLGLPPDAGRFFVLSTAAVSILGYEHHVRVIHAWNLTGSVRI